MSHTVLKLAVVSNFMALEIRDSLDVWFQTLDIDPVLTFGPYDSVIQQLLDPRRTFADCDLAVILLQLERWCTPGEAAPCTVTANNVASFVSAVGSAASESPTCKFLVISCPISVKCHAGPAILLIEDQVRGAFRDIANVDFIGTRERDTYYPVATNSAYYASDAFADDPAASDSLPYSQLCFATLGTIVARFIHGRFMESRKVIVVDCDNTLWSGICAESGSDSVTMGGGNLMLQEILVRQSNNGQLVCLCSKNDEQDVFAVFDRNLGMVLRRDNLTSHRINWRPKADNLRSLSEELRLGLKDFIFIDDDPFECESVRSLCPAVRTIRAPHDQAEFSHLLLQIWDFDKAAVTEEDTRRKLYYQHNAERDRALTTALTLTDFLESLDLKVHILPMRVEDTVRVAQLLRRVSQFNLNGIFKTVSELVSLIGMTPCYTIRVADRFGDYGLVGAVVYRNLEGVLHVETLALSCRSLGRGVELHLKAHFAEVAADSKSAQLSFEVRTTSRNEPLRTFLTELGCEDNGQGQYMVMTDALDARPKALTAIYGCSRGLKVDGTAQSRS
jgi:FkbH-like protein